MNKRRHPKRTFTGKECLIPLLVFALLAFPGLADAATYYMPDNFGTLASAFSGMEGGDTLIIRDGTYTGTDNQVRYNNKPPSGSVGNYTTIQAENPGSVQFDGEDSRDMFDGYGTFTMSYVIFKGIEWVNHPYAAALTGKAHNDRSAHHIKFLRCGFEDEMGIDYASYILLEDCYVTGNGRYNYKVRVSDHVILRRCVARLDDANGDGSPIAHFCNYASQDVEFQNCIAIDSDDDYYSNFEGIYGGWLIRQSQTVGSITYSSTNTKLRGCIVLNVHHDRSGTWSPGWSGYSIGYGASGLEWENCVFWDMHSVQYRSSSINYNYTMDHCTFGISGNGSDSHEDFVDSTSTSYGDISNSIFYKSGDYAIENAKSSTYNSFYDNSGGNKRSVGSSSNDITDVDPIDGTPGNGTAALKYLCRIEDSSDLDGAASDSRDIGATVTKRYGTSETLHGESGYATLTSDDIWPWPHEDIVREFFRTYGASSNPSPDRGFCADGETLTHYIWGYLGNTIPPFNIQVPLVGNQSVRLTWDANTYDGNVTGYKVYAGTASGTYDVPGYENGKDVGNTTTAVISGLTNDTPFFFAVMAVDSAKGESGPSYEISAAPIGGIPPSSPTNLTVKE